MGIPIEDMKPLKKVTMMMIKEEYTKPTKEEAQSRRRRRSCRRWRTTARRTNTPHRSRCRSYRSPLVAVKDRDDIVSE